MTVIDNKYNYGDIVYLATDEYQLARIVTAVCLRDSQISYELSCGSNMPSWHQEIEITPEKNIIKSLEY